MNINPLFNTPVVTERFARPRQDMHSDDAFPGNAQPLPLTQQQTTHTAQAPSPTPDHVGSKPVLDLVEILIEHGRQQEAIIARMGDAVAANDKEAVFELAKELIDNGSTTENSRRAA